MNYIMIEIQFELAQFILGIVLAGLLAGLSYRLKALSVSGAFGTLLVGTVVFGLGGWLYSAPLIFFFISSNLLSKLKSEIKNQSRKSIEKAGARDIWQVFANGGVATACVLLQAFTSEYCWFYIYLASLGASSADTWATEVGTLMSSKPRSILTFKRVQTGVSGGVSIPGTFASLIGSALTVFSVLPFLYNDLNLRFLIFAVLTGFLGSIVDSIFGASVQASFNCEVCGKNTETISHCGNPTKLVRGIRIINNDFVNILSNFIIVIILYMLIV